MKSERHRIKRFISINNNLSDNNNYQIDKELEDSFLDTE